MGHPSLDTTDSASDEDCDLNFVPHTAQERPIQYALSNSFGFGGTNGTLLFKRMD